MLFAMQSLLADCSLDSRSGCLNLVSYTLQGQGVHEPGAWYLSKLSETPWQAEPWPRLDQ